MRAGDDPTDEGTVKSGRKKLVITVGQTKMVKCGVRTGALGKQQDVLFEPSLDPYWPEGLQIESGIVRLQRGTWSHVPIPVVN